MPRNTLIFKALGADSTLSSIDRLRGRIFWAAALFALMLVSVQAIKTWQNYRAAIAHAQTRASDLAYILAAHMRESVAALDASLVQIGVANRRLGGPRGDSADWHAVLTGALAGMPSTGSLSVVDSQGIIRQSTIPHIVGQSRRDLYMIQYLSRQPGAGLVADKPFNSTMMPGVMLIPLGRRLDGPDGSFEGAVVATLQLPQLRQFYRAIHVGPGGSIRVLHTEGRILFREPSVRNPIDTPAYGDPAYQAYRHGEQQGSFIERALDGSVKIAAFHALPSPGMLIVASLDRRGELAGWREDLVVDGSLLAAELLVLAIGTAAILSLLEAQQAAAWRLERRKRQLILAESIAGMGAVTFEPARDKVRASPNIAALFGWPEPIEDVAMPDFLASLHEDDRPQLEEAVRNSVRTGEAYCQEFRVTRPDGSERIVWSEGYLDPDSPDEAREVIAICQDVTDRRLSERQLIQSQKMEGLGQLTGGVAHDFNNLLTVISLNLETIADTPGIDAEAREMADVALKATDRGADLVRSLLAFARRQPLRPRVVDVNEIVAETEHLLRRSLGERISLETALDPEGWQAIIDPAQLQAALVNLAVNARDAMEGKGKLTIETKNVVLDPHYAEQHADVRPGAYVMVAVTDTGAGIPSNMLDRVFEPFFTTKPSGKGTGLGLSMVYGFIKQSNGHVKIYSEVGHGTAVKLYLPRSDDIAAPEEHAAPAISVESGGEAILVVEDDEPIRDFIVRQLRQLGYRVMDAADATTALEAFDRPDAIDLLLTDVMLPGEKTGKQLADEAIERRPELKVIYMSGYTENAVIHHGRLDPGITLLAKPFRASELARTVRSVIARDRQPT
jgi:PAS domain S-box-containing protein